MKEQPKNNFRELIQNYLNDLNKQYPDSTVNPSDSLTDNVQSMKPKLKEQKEPSQEEIAQAMIYAKKELVQTRQAIQTLMKELSSLPTYQYIKPQVDNLISTTDDLEALLLNRFNQKQVEGRSPADWKAIQRIRMFLVTQLLLKYKKY